MSLRTKTECGEVAPPSEFNDDPVRTVRNNAYKALYNKYQTLREQIWTVGERVRIEQGWCESGFESVMEELGAIKPEPLPLKYPVPFCDYPPRGDCPNPPVVSVANLKKLACHTHACEYAIWGVTLVGDRCVRFHSDGSINPQEVRGDTLERALAERTEVIARQRSGKRAPQ